MRTRERAPRGLFVTRPGFDATNATLAVAPGGERIAASVTGPADGPRVDVRRRLRGGDWSEPQVVATGQVRPYDDLSVAVGPTGDAVVWWTSERVPSPRRSVLMTAVRPAGATTFSPAEPLAEGRLSRASLQLDAAGNAVASWKDGDADASRIARRPASSVWNAPESFPVTGRSVVDDFHAPDLAVAPNGARWPRGASSTKAGSYRTVSRRSPARRRGRSALPSSCPSAGREAPPRPTAH